MNILLVFFSFTFPSANWIILYYYSYFVSLKILSLCKSKALNQTEYGMKTQQNFTSGKNRFRLYILTSTAAFIFFLSAAKLLPFLVMVSSEFPRCRRRKQMCWWFEYFRRENKNRANKSGHVWKNRFANGNLGNSSIDMNNAVGYSVHWDLSLRICLVELAASS